MTITSDDLMNIVEEEMRHGAESQGLASQSRPISASAAHNLALLHNGKRPTFALLQEH